MRSINANTRPGMEGSRGADKHQSNAKRFFVRIIFSLSGSFQRIWEAKPPKPLICTSVEIELCTTLKYLGLWLDGNLSFSEHMKEVVEKADRTEALRKTMKEAIKRLFMNVSTSVLLYGVLVWSDAVKIPNRRVAMEKIQRKTTPSACIDGDSLCIVRQSAVYGAKKKAKMKREAIYRPGTRSGTHC